MIRFKTLTLTYLFCILYLSGYAQTYNYKNYTVDNGLPSSEVFHAVQDHKGFIWFATNEGVSRFDGYRFHNYSNMEGLPENTILEIFEDEMNRLWFMSISGKLSWYQYDSIYQYPYNKVITNFKEGKDYPIKKSFYIDSLSNICAGFYRRNLIHISSEGILKELPPDDKENNLIKFISDSSFIYTVLFKDKISLEIHRPNNQVSVVTLPKSFKSARTIAALYKQQILFTNYRDLYVIDRIGNVYNYHFPNEIIWLSTDSKGLLWVGLLKGGALAFNDLDFNNPVYHLVKDKSVSSVLNDSEKGYWFATLEDGVYYYPSLEIKSLTKKDGLNSDLINQIAVKDDRIFFGGDRLYIYEYDLNTLVEHHYKIPKEPRACRLLEFIGDTLVVGNNYSGTQFIYKDRIVKSAGSCYRKVVKIGTDSLVYFIRKDIRAYLSDEKKEISIHGVSRIFDALSISKNIIWFGTDNGLYELNLKQWQVNKIYDDEPLSGRVIKLLKDHNTIWIGTKGSGLIKLDDNRLTQFSMKDGLPGNSINSLIKKDSLLWLGTNNGICKLVLNNRQDAITSIWALNSGHGLVTNEIKEIALFKEHIFAGTSKGLSYFNKDYNVSSSPIYITGFKVNETEKIIQPTYSLEYNQNFIEISFVGLNYKRNNELRYLYKLEGVDKEWNETENTTVRYTALSPGNYKFQVRCVNSYGVLSKNDAVLSFKINKAYYQTLLFKIIVLFISVFIISLITFQFFRIKIRELRHRNKMERELNRFRQQALSAQMNPHFIFNSLNSVQNYILKNDPIKSSDYLSRFGALMRRVLENSQTSEISLKEELEALKLYIDLELVRFQNDFECEYNISKQINLERIKVPPLIMQPFVENAIHHGLRLKQGEKKIKISIFKKYHRVYIHIEDSGIGRERAGKMKHSKKHKSYGSDITNKRLNIYSALYKNDIKVNFIDLNSEQESTTGTRVEIEFTELEN